MSRRSLALFLATTGLLTSLSACGGEQDAHEKGGDSTPSGQTASPSRGSDDEGDKHDNRDGGKDHKGDEGGEGGEGGEG